MFKSMGVGMWTGGGGVACELGCSTPLPPSNITLHQRQVSFHSSYLESSYGFHENLLVFKRTENNILTVTTWLSNSYCYQFLYYQFIAHVNKFEDGIVYITLFTLLKSAESNHISQFQYISITISGCFDPMMDKKEIEIISVTISDSACCLMLALALKPSI